MLAGNSADLAPSTGTSPAQSENEQKKPVSAEAPEQRDLLARLPTTRARRALLNLYRGRQFQPSGGPKSFETRCGTARGSVFGGFFKWWESL
jgi:hypothetical protein